MRMVHSLTSSTDDWDDQLESFETGWPGFIEALRVYLRHYPGRPAAAVHAVVHQPGDQADMWRTLSTALNLAGGNVGERRETSPGSPRLAGVIERVHQDGRSREVMLRLDEPTEGVAVVGTCQPGGQASGIVSLFFYGADAAQTAAGERSKWNAWLADLLRAPATP
ncbi:hypothetical protein CQY20_04925 [Mycolicibacterium agri]|uniref:Uncharacterized protein n=1 Tax=Mycolicibacterium agri TaxID=36811 RepID=A0A2A7NCH0_MYCAG|nr:hypothetical protein CQY20_04925 [Mycolicibacterium agri]